MRHPITALIVTYNSAGHVRACAEAAGRYCDEVLVVDNASADATLAEIPASGRVIANPVNLGFAGGVNQGMRAAKHPRVLLLNPDAVLLDDPAPLIEADAAVVAGLLVDEHEAAQTGFAVRRFPTPAALALEALGVNRLWPGNPLNRRWRALDLDLTQAQPVEQPAGAFWLLRREAWAAVGGLDERFHPVWFEDVDFLKRLAGAGLSIWFQPAVRARHVGGHAVGRLAGGLRQEYWYASLIQYAGKHFAPASRRVVAGAVSLGAAARWGLSLFQGPSAQANRRGYRRAAVMAFRSLWAGGAVQ